MEDDDIVALEAKLAQPLEDRLGLVEQVGHQDNQATSLHLAGDVFENLADVGFARRAALFQSAQDLRQIIALGARRHERFDMVGEGDEAGGVLLLENKISERCCERAAVVKFRNAIRGIIHRRAGVEKEIRAQVGFIFILFDEVAVEFAERLPIDAANFIAWRVFAVFFEFDTETLGATPMHAGHQSLDDPAGAQGKIGDPSENLGIEIVFGAVGHGLFLLSRIEKRRSIAILYPRSSILKVFLRHRTAKFLPLAFKII